MLLRARSFGVAFYARADHERWCRLLCSCGSGALMLPFMLVQTRSFVPCSLDSCWQGALVRAGKELWFVQFRLVRTRNIGSCSLGSCEQHWCCLLCSCRPGALCHAV
ncbi:hypothetical protein ACFX2A_031336 [Malus domestica]